MPSFLHRCLRFIPAFISGFGLTLTIFCGVCIMRAIQSQYLRAIPGISGKEPAITLWFDTMPRHGVPSLLALCLLLTGFTWLSVQTQESALTLLHRVAIAFIALGILVYALPFVAVGQLVEDPPVPWAAYRNEFLWLIPCAIPLAIALNKHRQGSCPATALQMH